MSRKTPAPVPHFRPVSQKAYDTFVRRIYAVIPMDHRCADTIDALDKYLAGDRETYAAHLDEHTAMAFEMLRFEIDLAIVRSARARRPRRRKAETMPTVTEAHILTESTPEKSESQSVNKKNTATPTPRPTAKRRPAVSGSERPATTVATQTNAQNENAKDKPTDTPDQPPRWMRRAAIMAMRPKNKWKKIG